ncbi:MAG: hypothetical protein AB8I58_19020 [Anaerolineales bacterium]|jgi:hypothetical protein
MPYTVILHIANESPIIGEVEELPKPNDSLITVHNPRQKDGKDIHYLEHNVVEVIWPLYRISFIEILASEEEDQIIGFVRE